ncbi:MAG: VCBS repeat-containing protein [Acidobacteria bacterium]|nr:VCBS repeat-containing protein [Acidobacteriota bacterium]
MNQPSRTVLRAGLTVFLTLAAGLLLGLRTQEPKQARQPAARAAAKKTATSRPASLQTHRNVGKAYYEQAQYAEAIGEFQKVMASGHALATDYLNLGLALIQANRLNDALGALTTAKQMDASLVAADYNLGILYKHELRYPDSEAALQRVVNADPGDPAAWFNLGGVRFAQRKLEEALDAYKHVVEIGFGRGQNFYVASLFRAFTVLSQLKRPEDAQKFLHLHEKMHNKVPDISLQNPALEGGKYGTIIVPVVLPIAPPKSADEKITFVEITDRIELAKVSAISIQPEGTSLPIRRTEYSLKFSRASIVAGIGASLAMGDYDGDGRTDLYLINPRGGNRLLRSIGNGTFSDVTGPAGVAGPGGSVAAIFSDYDNSGKTSIFVAGMGGVQLFRNRGDGTFADESENAGLRGDPGELATSAVLFDADNDGFLDLVVSVCTNPEAFRENAAALRPGFSGAAVRYYRNNGDGTFTEMTKAAGLGSAKGRARKVLFADFDNDGFMDLLIVRDDGPPLLYINQGEGKFADQTSKAGADFARFTAMDAQATDLNHDGNFDVVLWPADGCQVLLGRGDGSFSAAANLPRVAPPTEAFALRGITADVNGDGFDDLLAVDSSGKWHLLANRAGHFEEAKLELAISAEDGVSLLAAAWLEKPGKLNLVGVTQSGRLIAFEKVGPPSRWVEVKLSGAKSNTQGGPH